MFYEKRVDSARSLMKELENLDSDAGVRLRAEYLGRDSFVFLTRFEGKYTAMIYAVKGKNGGAVGKMLGASEFSGVKELERFLNDILSGQVEAFVY